MPWFFWPLLTAWGVYLVFVVLYATRSPWRQTPIGRSWLLSKTVIVALLTNAIVSVAVGHYPGRFVVWGVLFSVLTVAGAWQVRVLVKLQNRPPCDHPLRRSTDHP